MIERIYDVYGQSTERERRDGLSYYRRQRDRLSRLAERAGVPVHVAVGVFCALSPNNDEVGNYRDALVILSNRDHGFPVKVSTYGANKRKAERIVIGEHPKDVLRGNKIISFYLNTVDPSDPHPVTVDGHMFNLWRGERINLVKAAALMTNSKYCEIAEGFRKAAKQLDLLPCQLQSTIWQTWKRVHKARYDPQLTLFHIEEVADWKSRVIQSERPDNPTNAAN